MSGRASIAAALVLAVYGGLALSVDFPRAAFGFKSDEATYYMMAHSLAEDGDLSYRREDLVRVWREFPAGPTGLFLKKGRDVSVSFGGAFPFVHLRYRPDPRPARLYYGKSYMYPLVAAPFVWLFGTNGFLLLHALLLRRWCSRATCSWRRGRRLGRAGARRAAIFWPRSRPATSSG